MRRLTIFRFVSNSVAIICMNTSVERILSNFAKKSMAKPLYIIHSEGIAYHQPAGDLCTLRVMRYKGGKTAFEDIPPYGG